MAGFNPLQFIDEVKRETKKVVWPTLSETRTATIMVFIMVTICSLFLFATDQIISAIIKRILGI
jgi:preprotein translocase subunit SecE